MYDRNGCGHPDEMTMKGGQIQLEFKCHPASPWLLTNTSNGFHYYNKVQELSSPVFSKLEKKMFSSIEKTHMRHILYLDLRFEPRIRPISGRTFHPPENTTKGSDIALVFHNSSSVRPAVRIPSRFECRPPETDDSADDRHPRIDRR